MKEAGDSANSPYARAIAHLSRTSRGSSGPNACQERIVMDAISPIWNEMFADIFRQCSHGFRKGRGTQSFFAQVESWGKVDQVVPADIVSCFDRIPLRVRGTFEHVA